MANELAKAMKWKRDAEQRLYGQTQKPVVIEDTEGGFYAPEQADYTAQLAQGKNITITTSGNIKTIAAVMNLLEGSNISVSAPDENGAVTITGTIGGKEIDLTGLTDGYVLTYDGVTDKFIVSEVSGSYTLPQATETVLGGIKAKAKTTESSEVVIDTTTGKLYVSASGGVIAADVPIADTAGNYTATDVEGALSELFIFVSNGKSLIAGAITDKGVSTSATDTFGTMATNISSISGGGASMQPVLDLDGIDNTGSGHDASATTWKDLSSTVADAVKAAGNTAWGDKYLRLDGSTYWNVNAPNLSRGTMEVVVSIDTDFVPINTTLWYSASCLFGNELGGSQQDFGILVDANGKFAIGFANSTIYSSTINAKDGMPHTISYSYYRGPVQFAIDGVVIAILTTACTGSEVSSLGIGWNKNSAASKVKGKIYSVKWFKELLTSDQVSANHNANKLYYGF